MLALVCVSQVCAACAATRCVSADADRYPAARMRQFVDKLHADGQHWAPIFNPGISVSKGYRAYEEGTAQGVWIKDVNGNPYIGQVRVAVE